MTSQEEIRDLISRLVEAAIEEYEIEADAIADRLVRIGKPAVEPLLELVNHEELDVQHYAIEILGRIGDKQAAPVLERMLEEVTDPALLEDIIPALARIRSKTSVPKLIKALKHPNYHTRLHAIHALAEMRAIEALSSLEEVIAQDLPIPAQEAKIAIAYILEGIDGLKRIYYDPQSSSEVRDSVLTALAEIAQSGGEITLSILLDAAKHDRDPKIRQEALRLINQALWSIETGKIPTDLTREIIAEATQVLSAANEDRYRLSAVCIFRELGNESHIEFLRQVAKTDPYETVRQVAKQALRRIAQRAKKRG